MKNSRFAKIAILALSLALVIGAVVGISVSAKDTDSGIIAHNIVYGEKVAVAFAVDATLEEAESLKVAYYWEGDQANLKNATLLDTSVAANVANIDGKQYPVFVTAGLPAKELTKVAYATVYTGDAPAEDAVWESYSVAEYLYVRLYVDGFEAKTEADGLDYNRKLLYKSLIEYGNNAQIIFGYNTDKLIADYDIAYTDDITTTINGGDYAFGYDLQINAAYTGEGNLESWVCTDALGNETESVSDTININGAIKIEPKLGVHECTDSNNDHICDVCTEKSSDCGDTNLDGKCDICKVYSFEFATYNTVTLYTFDNLTNKNLVKQDVVTTEDTVASYYGYAGQLITDPTNAANQVLQILVNDGSKNSNTTSQVNNVSNIKLAPSVINEGGKVHVVEFDFNLMHFQKQTGTTITDPFSFYAYDKDGNLLGELQHHSTTAKYAGFISFDSITNEATPDLENNYHFGNNDPRTAETEPTSYGMYDAQKWYRFRFIWNEATNAIYFDVSFDEGKTWYKAYDGDRSVKGGYTAEAAYIQIEFQQCYQAAYNYLFDDISYTVVDTVPTRPAVLGNDDAEYPNGR